MEANENIGENEEDNEVKVVKRPALEDLVPRNYQLEMLVTVIRRNSIVYLPTGAGKTFIAYLAMKHFYNKLEAPLSAGGKRIVFVASKVALVVQQYNVIQRQSPFTVAMFNGDMNVDSWSKEEWQKQIQSSEVLVMGTQILLNILDKSHFKMSDICLLIIDECHHAKGAHPMKQLMKYHYDDNNPEMPRVLGLTATLTKGSVTEESLCSHVAELEENLHSRIVRHSNDEDLEGLYANPDLEIIEVRSTGEPDEQVKDVIETLKDAPLKDITQAKDLFSLALQKQYHELGTLLVNKDSFIGDMQTTILDILHHIEHLAKLSVKYHCNRFKVIKSNASARKIHTLKKMLCHLETVQEKMDHAMAPHTDIYMQMYYFSSSKVHILFEQLQKQVSKYKENICGIVFTHRRVTAVLLYHLMMIAIEKFPSLSIIKPDVALGGNKNKFGTTEQAWNSLKLRKGVDKFNKGITNLCFATEVLEEGIDIPRCNFVIRFDKIPNMCSYIQSKGRARDQKSTFFVFDESNEFLDKLPRYMAVEKLLKSLQTNEVSRAMNEDQTAPQLRTKCGAIVTAENATRLIWRYCSSLSNGKAFVCAKPVWFFKTDTESNKVKVSMILPEASPYKKPITGKWSNELSKAKASCAVEAVKLLFSMDELDDNLMPKHKVLEIEELNSKELFKHFKEDDDIVSNGQKEKCRVHPIHYPETLRDIAPVAGEETYLHILDIAPSCKRPVNDKRRGVFHDLLKSKTQGFALLTSKRWPQLCKFPVYTNFGEAVVDISPNADVIKLSTDELIKVREFNMILFETLLEIKHDFLIADYESGNCNLLLVPLVLQKGGCNIKPMIDWHLLELKKHNEDLNCLKICHEHGNQSLQGRVIVPLHSPKQDGQGNIYIVTAVREDLNPLSTFDLKVKDNCLAKNHAEYYDKKYSRIVTDRKQPLLEIRPVSRKINMLTQGKDNSLKVSKGFVDVFFLPEFCAVVSLNEIFSSQLWLKATTLPTVIARTCRLLNADEFRCMINREIKIGVEELPEGMSWEPFEVNTFDVKYIGLPNAYKHRNSHQKPLTKAELLLRENSGKLIDLNYDMLTATDAEIERYATLANIPLEDSFDSSSNSFMERDTSITVKPLQIISATSAIGPQLHQIYKAFTSSTAFDAVDMERLEILGDSYLKYAISVYLFETYDFKEGAMSSLKSKLVGNRNLYCCALKKNINGYLHYSQLIPRSEWKPPNYEVPPEVKAAALAEKFEHRTLVKLLGASKTRQGMKEKASYNMFFDVQLCPDKSVADVVEALIGAYVECCGHVDTADLLAWFGIAPPTLKDLLTKPAEMKYNEEILDDVTSLPAEIRLLVPNLQKLERTLGYKFKNQGFLLEAVTHGSFITNRITSSNERMEYLGDAVLDFLITCHIYEHCGNLSPGAVTDLRASIVNNNVFGSYVVRYGLHTYLLHNSVVLFGLIDDFVEHQIRKNHEIDDECLYDIKEDNQMKVATCVEIPKVLGDLWESLACAVYLDSGKDLATTWNVFYPLMKKEIDKFAANPPRQPYRLLLETYGYKNCGFESIEKDGNQLMKVTVRCGKDTYTCYGEGKNKKLARNAGSKYMVQLIDAEKSNRATKRA